MSFAQRWSLLARSGVAHRTWDRVFCHWREFEDCATAPARTIQDPMTTGELLTRGAAWLVLSLYVASEVKDAVKRETPGG